MFQSMKVIQKRVLFLDTSIIFSVLGISALSRSVLELHYDLSSRNAVDALVTGIIFSINLFTAGCYEERHIGTGVDETKRIIQGATNAFLIIGTISFVFKREPSRFVLFLAFLVGLALLVAGRKLLLNRLVAARSKGQFMRKTLILGSAKYADEMTSILNSNPYFGYSVVGRLEIHSELSLTNQQVWLRTIDQSISDGGVQVIIIEDSEDTNQKLLNLVSWHLNNQNVEVLIAMSFIEALGPRLDLSLHHELPLMYLDEPKLSAVERIIKRTLDIILATTATVIFLPFMLLIALGVLVSSGRPVLYTQERVGLSGKRFKFIKFRTMIVGADTMRDEVLGTPDEEMTDRYKADPRIYPFGKFLRRFSLDELPQLVSVIKGDMSLVGPRPLLVDELPLLGDEDHRRHLTKPGLTGLWQVSGRKETTWNERIQLDLQYVHNWSIGLDVGILLKTIRVVATGHGSY